MYQKYHTEALVLRSYERGEADKVFGLYTKEFGHVWARASAVRREKSLMRYALQQYAHVNISLVRGMTGWRAAGATALSHIAPDAVATFARIARLTDRLVAGEEKNDYLYATLADARAALAIAQRESHGAIELLAVARILYALGYLSADALGSALFTHTAFELPQLAEAETARSELLLSVNKALSETHL